MSLVSLLYPYRQQSVYIVLCRPLTGQEVAIQGLLGLKKGPALEVVDLGPKGRGVVTSVAISRGDYICEYKTYRVYPAGSPEALALGEEYERNGEGSYILETAYVVPKFGRRLCFDATRHYNDIGRLINHSPATSKECNIRPFRPYYVRNKWRVGFVAKRDIAPGEELAFDYQVRGEPWMGKAGGGGSGSNGGSKANATPRESTLKGNEAMGVEVGPGEEEHRGEEDGVKEDSSGLEMGEDIRGIGQKEGWYGDGAEVGEGGRGESMTEVGTGQEDVDTGRQASTAPGANTETILEEEDDVILVSPQKCHDTKMAVEGEEEENECSKQPPQRKRVKVKRRAGTVALPRVKQRRKMSQ